MQLVQLCRQKEVREEQRMTGLLIAMQVEQLLKAQSTIIKKIRPSEPSCLRSEARARMKSGRIKWNAFLPVYLCKVLKSNVDATRCIAC